MASTFFRLLPTLLVVASCRSEPSEPSAEIVFPRLTGGALFDSWSVDGSRIFFVGGAAASACFGGARDLVEYDGYGWHYLETEPGHTDGGLRVATPDGGCPCPDGGAGCQAPDQPVLGALRAIFSFSSDELYVAGDSATILRVRRGAVEQLFQSNEDRPDFTSLWGTSVSDLWAAGGVLQSGDTTATPRIYHFDGVTWDRISLPPSTGTLLSMWGASADNVWAVGQGGMILHFDGVSWTAQAGGMPPTSETLVSVRGLDAEHVYAVGGDQSATFLRYDGSHWQRVPNTLPPRLLSILPFGDRFIVTGQSGVVAVGTVDDLRPISVGPSTSALSFHTIASLAGGGFVVGGGNLFDLTRKELFGAVLAIDTTLSSVLTAPAEGGFLTVPAPPPVVGGSNSGPW